MALGPQHQGAQFGGVMKIMTGEASFPGVEPRPLGQGASEAHRPKDRQKDILAERLNYGLSLEAKKRQGQNFFKPPPERH